MTTPAPHHGRIHPDSMSDREATLEQALRGAREWIEAAPEDTWGFGNTDDKQWPIRDEIIANIDRNLAPYTGPYEERAFTKLEAEVARQDGEIRGLIEAATSASKRADKAEDALTTARTEAIAETEAAIVGWLRKIGNEPSQAERYWFTIANAIQRREYLPPSRRTEDE